MALDYSSLPDDVEHLKQQLLKYATWVESLKDEVVRLRRWRFGRSSEAIDTSIALELPLSGGEASSAIEIGPSSVTGTVIQLPRLEAVDRARDQRKPRAARALPPELPRIVIEHHPQHCQCPQCGGVLTRLGEDVAEQLDYVPGYFQVIRHVRPKSACRRCEHIVQAPAPSRPIERGLPTAGLLAQVIGAKYADHCPLYRQEGIYRRSGVELPRAMLASWVSAAAQRMEPLVHSLERYVLSANKLHADDTPVPVLAPGSGKTKTGRLWAYVRDDRPSSSTDPPAVFYRYSPDRKAEHPQAHLRTFAGVLQADGYAGFNALYAREAQPLIDAACWAHARRKFYDVYVQHRSPTAAEALLKIGELYAVERLLRGQSPEARVQARRTQAAPLLHALHAWLKAQRAQLLTKSSLAAAIDYALTRWVALTRYVDDGRIEIDNNAAERAIRALVLGRRNYLFAGSDAGGETAARLYSLIGTCRLNHIDPHAYLKQVLERIADHPINRIDELLPWRLADHPSHVLPCAA